MNLNHIHLGVRDLGEALHWLDRIWHLQPEFQNERMAIIPFHSFILILDPANEEVPPR